MSDKVEALQEEIVRLRAQLVYAQRMESTGTLAAGIAHDMNNLIGAILGLAELLAEEATPEAGEDLTAIAREAERAGDLMRSLLAYARGRDRRGVLSIDAMLDEVEPLVSRLRGDAVVLERRGATGAMVEGDAGQLAQAIVNLCINGADAMAGTGILVLTAAADDERVSISVRDSGSGMSDAVRARIFEPFFSTKHDGGMGLGLPMVLATVEAHGGSLDVTSAEGKGSTFTITLPLTRAVPPPPPLAKGTARIARRRELAIVVDDHPLVRAVAARTLRRMGMAVIEASDERGLIEVIAARGGELTVVVLDPGVPIDTVRALTAVPFVRLAKPYRIDELRAEIERVLDG